MNKLDYRLYLLHIKRYIKLNIICEEVGISRTAVYNFMNGIDGAISLDTLERLYKIIKSL